MVIKSKVEEINKLISCKRSFILCTYYLDSYSNFYTAMLNKELNKDLIDIYYLEVEELMKLCNLNKRIFPIFCIYIKGKLSWKTCGFISYNELYNEFTKKSVLFS